MPDAAEFCARLTASHFRRAGQPMPPWLADYIHRTLDGTASGTKCLTTQEVADILGITARGVVKQAPRLAGRKIGRQWLFDATEVARIARQRNHRAAPRPCHDGTQ